MSEHANGEPQTDVREMLRALADIDRVIAERAERTLATIEIQRSLLLGLLFGFYQLVEWNPEPFRAIFGPSLYWLWLLPLLAARVIAMALRSRIERLAREAGVNVRLPQVWLPALVGATAAFATIWTGHTELLPGVLLVAMGILTYTTAFRGRERTRLGLLWRIYSGAQVVVGLAFLAARPAYAFGIMGLIWVIGGLTLGTLRYQGYR